MGEFLLYWALPAVVVFVSASLYGLLGCLVAGLYARLARTSAWADPERDRAEVFGRLCGCLWPIALAAAVVVLPVLGVVFSCSWVYNKAKGCDW